MQEVTFLYGKGPGFSGQRIASELIIQGLRQRGWQVQVINTPVLDRINAHNRSKLILTRLALGWHLLEAWSKAFWSGIRSEVLYVNLGQTTFALIRDGLPLLIKSIFEREGRAIVSLHGNVFMEWADYSLEAKLFRFMTRPVRFITILALIRKSDWLRLVFPIKK
jgi:hypothetical protein